MKKDNKIVLVKMLQDFYRENRDAYISIQSKEGADQLFEKFKNQCNEQIKKTILPYSEQHLENAFFNAFRAAYRLDQTNRSNQVNPASEFSTKLISKLKNPQRYKMIPSQGLDLHLREQKIDYESEDFENKHAHVESPITLEEIKYDDIGFVKAADSHTWYICSAPDMKKWLKVKSEYPSNRQKLEPKVYRLKDIKKSIRNRLKEHIVKDKNGNLSTDLKLTGNALPKDYVSKISMHEIVEPVTNNLHDRPMWAGSHRFFMKEEKEPEIDLSSFSRDARIGFYTNKVFENIYSNIQNNMKGSGEVTLSGLKTDIEKQISIYSPEIDKRDRSDFVTDILDNVVRKIRHTNKDVDELTGKHVNQRLHSDIQLKVSDSISQKLDLLYGTEDQESDINPTFSC